MGIIDDLNATKQRLAQWQAEQETIHTNAIAQVKQHVATQTAIMCKSRPSKKQQAPRRDVVTPPRYVVTVWNNPRRRHFAEIAKLKRRACCVSVNPIGGVEQR